jgi:alpha-tubulin suppressor-like RCC1 family protein
MCDPVSFFVSPGGSLAAHKHIFSGQAERCCWCSSSQSLLLVVVPDVGTVQSISAGYFHTCSVSETGTAHCWGLDDDGQLGDGTNSGRTVPTNVKCSEWYSTRTLCGSRRAAIICQLYLQESTC